MAFTPPSKLTTAVLFLVFNRPDTTAQVFEAIRTAKPTRLYVAADGPRAAKDGEAQKCEQVRKIVTNIDWPCDLKVRFQENNFGCKTAVSSAIDWFFENETMGIILEDDCLPCQSFFWFCQDLLEKYKDDTRIWLISGNNFQNNIQRGDGGYYFSKYNTIWGWASWQRAWKHYDVTMAKYPTFKKNNCIKNIWNKRKQQKYWLKAFEAVYNGKIDTWDYQSVFSMWIQNGLSILPNVNMVSNIGFGMDSTHTSDVSDGFANLPTADISFPLKHPSFILQDIEADNYTFDQTFVSIYKKIISRLRQSLC